MERSLRKLLVGVWSAVTCVFALTAWAGCQHLPTQKQHLPNGWHLELAKVTYGREHRFTKGTFGQQAWQTAVSLGKPPPVEPVALNYRRTAADEPRLWFRWTGKAESLWDAWSAVALDEHGCSFLCSKCSGLQSLSNLLCAGSESPELKQKICAASLLSYPRRADHFRYALLRVGKPQDALTYQVDLPPRPVTRSWIGSRCPVTARDQEATFVLTRLKVLPDRPGYAEAHFRCFEAGKPSVNWRPDQVTVSDVTGNSVELMQSPLADELTAELPTLCRRESAWKVRVRFIRKLPTRARAEFTWKARNEPPSRKIQFVSENEFVSSDPQVRWRGLSFDRPKGVWASGCIQTSCLAALRAQVPDMGYSLAILSASHPSGRALELPEIPHEPLNAGRHLYQFQLPWELAEGPLDLTFGLYRTHTVEFIVRPD